jgi:hypothetical protein
LHTQIRKNDNKKPHPSNYFNNSKICGESLLETKRNYFLVPTTFARPITDPDKRSTSVTSAERAETQENPRVKYSAFLGEFENYEK